MKEHVFRYGETKYGMGFVTTPDDLDGAPVVVLFNAGLLHRAEPYRMNVLLCRQLAQIGYIAVRIDLSGKGDTPARPQMSNRESVALDWQFIKNSIEQAYGKRKYILFGLCSGADNGIKIAAQDNDVQGLILLDPISRTDEAFKSRQLWAKILNPSKWRHALLTLPKRLKRKPPENKFAINLRDEPTGKDLDDCCRNLIDREGCILAVFSSYAANYYNQKGQFCRAMSMEGLDRICEEVYWPEAEHLYSVQSHRDRLLNRIVEWGKLNLPRLKAVRPRV